MTNPAQPASRLSRPARHRDESGAAMVEFALVVTLFMFLLYGIIAYGITLGVKHNVTQAAFSGARAAVGAGNDAAAVTAAQAKVDEAMSSFDSAHYTKTAVVAPCVNDASVNCITVTVTYDYEDHPVVPSAPGLGIVLPKTLGGKAVVQL